MRIGEWGDKLGEGSYYPLTCFKAYRDFDYEHLNPNGGGMIIDKAWLRHLNPERVKYYSFKENISYNWLQPFPFAKCNDPVCFNIDGDVKLCHPFRVGQE